MSGFSTTGRKEFLPGSQDQTIAVSFLQDFAAGVGSRHHLAAVRGRVFVPDPRSAGLGRWHLVHEPDLLGNCGVLLVPGRAERSTSGRKWSSSSSPPRTRCSTGLRRKMPGRSQGYGLGELVRTFKKMPVEVKEEMVWELEEAANPVKLAAQAKAPTSMRNMVKTKEWAAMRVGITRRNPATVYVVPQLRGGKVQADVQRQKDNFAANMQGRALDPALAENEGEGRNERVEDFLDSLGRKNGF